MWWAMDSVARQRCLRPPGFRAPTSAPRRGPRQSCRRTVPGSHKPNAGQPALQLKVPGLVVGAPDDRQSLSEPTRWTWPTRGTDLFCGSSAKASHRAWPKAVRVTCRGSPRVHDRTQKTTRALLTGFLLFHLTGDKAYREFADPEAAFPKTDHPDLTAPPSPPRTRLLRC